MAMSPIACCQMCGEMCAQCVGMLDECIAECEALGLQSMSDMLKLCRACCQTCVTSCASAMESESDV